MEEQLERYKNIASKLSFMTNERKFEINDVIDVDLDGEIIKVGPFQEVERIEGVFESGVYWQEKSGDAYVVYMTSDEWESWGGHYDDFGNNFEIGKVQKYVPVIEGLWENFPTPSRNRW